MLLLFIMSKSPTSTTHVLWRRDSMGQRTNIWGGGENSRQELAWALHIDHVREKHPRDSGYSVCF